MYKFKDIIEEVEERNTDLRYGLDDIVGVTIEKGLIPTIANLTQTSLDKFYIVKPETFVYNPRTHGVRLGMGFNNTTDIYITSWNNVAFRVTKDAQNIVIPQYLWLYFCRPIWDRLTNFFAWGSSTIVFAWNDFLNIDIDLPSIERQREIVSEYETLTNRIHLNEQMIQNLESTAQTLYRKMFVDNIDKENLPDGWRMGTIEDLSEFVVAGVIPNYVEEGDYKVLGQRCVHDHIVDLSFVKSHIPKSNCLYVQDGDILINSTGSGTLGRAGQIFNAQKNLAFDSNMTLVRPIGESAIDYLGLAIFEKEEYFVQISQGSTNQTRLYCSMVKPTELLIPSMSELEKFKEYVRPMRKGIEHKRQENSKLTELQSLLLAKMGQ